jgi:RecA/RadA recombinase
MAKTKTKSINKSSFISTMIASSGNKYADIVSDGIRTSDVYDYIDTGSYILNALLSGTIYGGLPDNKTLAFAGESGTGKTYAALSIVNNFLNKYDNSVVFYFDSESAVTSDMIKSRNIDCDRIVIMPVSTIEEFRYQAAKILDDYNIAKSENPELPRIMIVIDSLGQLASNKEINDIAADSDKRDMTKQQLLKSTFRVLSLKKSLARVPMVVTSHTYKEIGSMFPKSIMSGGSGLYYSADMIVFLNKSKIKDGKELTGNNIHCSLTKGRFTREGKVVVVGLSFTDGLLRYNGLLDLCEKYDIIKKVSTRYELPDGKKMFGKQIESNPEDVFTSEILNQIDTAAYKEFMYGKSEPEFPNDEELSEEFDGQTNEILS